MSNANRANTRDDKPRDVLRVGQVSTNNASTGSARMTLDDMENLVSNDLQIIYPALGKWMLFGIPRKGDHVAMLQLPNSKNAEGILLGTYYTAGHLPKNAEEGLVQIIAENGKSIIQMYDDGRLRVIFDKNIYVQTDEFEEHEVKHLYWMKNENELHETKELYRHTNENETHETVETYLHTNRDETHETEETYIHTNKNEMHETGETYSHQSEDETHDVSKAYTITVGDKITIECTGSDEFPIEIIGNVKFKTTDKIRVVGDIEYTGELKEVSDDD